MGNRVSLADRLVITKNRPAGFDYMRILLATAIVAWHTFITAQGDAAQYAVWNGPFRFIPGLTLPMFFALSGFLVAGSLERSKTLVSFLGLRVLRIMPALIVETVVSALIIGPIFTALPLGQYYSNPQFHAYLLNIVGDVHFYLPGVFSHNPKPYVINGQLWTVPWELACYATLAIIAFVGLAKTPLRVLAAFVVCQLVVGFYGLHHLRPAVSAVPGTSLVMCFLAGVIGYRWREKIVWSAPVAVIAALVTVACLVIPNADRIIAIPVAYLTVYLGLLAPRRLPVICSGDYSYGIFLYGFPIQQVMAALFPLAHTIWGNFLLAYPVVCTLAVASWWGVEKQAFRLRPLLMVIEQRWLALRSTLIPARPAAAPTGD